MRAQSGKGDNIAVRSHPTLDVLSQLQENARRILVRVGDLDRMVYLQILHAADALARIIDSGKRRSCLGGNWDRDRGDRRGCGRSRCAACEKLTAADIDQLVAALHVRSPWLEYR